MQYVQLGNRLFSRLICGSNPFYGHSHFSEARAAEHKTRFDDKEIQRVIELCVGKGINTVETSANERMVRIVANCSMKPDHLVSTTRIDETSTVKRHQDKLAMSINQGCSVCIVHSQYIDREREGQTINGLETLLEKIHEAGLLSGISTHSNAVIELCEQNKYAIDVYMFPLNNSGFVYPGYKGNESPSERASLVRDIEKPFILIKSMAAGRIPPSEALGFVHDCMKSNDMLSIGFGSADEARETIDIWERICQ